MDLRQYTHITHSPDTFPRCTLEDIKKVLFDINSQHLSLIDKILDNGYIPPPKSYEWEGYYRIILSVQEKQIILHELGRACTELLNNPAYDGNGIAYVKQFHGYWKRCIEEEPISYEEAIKTQQYYDLRNISLNQFEDFIFAHPVLQESDSQNWYNDIEMWIDYQEEDVVQLYIEMFRHSNELLNNYKRDQLEQGFWAIMGSRFHGCAIDELIWSDSVNMKEKIELIYAMYDLFKNLFSIDHLETSCNMWWDSLAYDFHPMKFRTRENEIERQIQDAMFNTLKSILESSSEECRISALHGLGHLQHPETEMVIKNHLKMNKTASEEYCNYANACIAGDIM